LSLNHAAEVVLDEVETDVKEEVEAADQWHQTMKVNSNKLTVIVLDMIVVLQSEMNLQKWTHQKVVRPTRILDLEPWRSYDR
jgi:Fe-S cluster biosynthesis and repair protein YggX